ncbi:MAG: hypothetical protein KDC28_01970 [Saprospiraceae bacterium]|nr:hypothetical protein [Saprospiraceae bacterium]MCB9320904.1 hypothetical protein [Lewinellaceae bacterium]
MQLRVFLTCAFVVLAIPLAFTQLNIETGFDWLAVNDPGLDQAISTHNEQQNYNRDFANLDHLFGFRLGTRYYLKSPVYTGIAWTIHLQSNKATNPAGQGNLTRRIYLQSHTWQAMLGASGRRAGIGTAVSYDLVSTRHKWENESRSVQLDRQGGFHQEAWLEWLLPGTSNVQLSLQPYARYQFGSRSTSELQQWLNDQVSDASGLQAWSYGIRIVLVNGPKP